MQRYYIFAAFANAILNWLVFGLFFAYEKLDKEGSENELARLLGGVSITRAVLDNAGEMKELAARGKAERRAARGQQ